MAVEENAAAAPEAAAADGPPPLSTTSPPPPYIVPPELIRAFKRDSVVVLPDVFTPEEVAEARAGMAATLKAHGVDVTDLAATAGHLRALSSTGGSGGVLDRYWMPWKLRLHQNPRFFQAISQLWDATFARFDPNTDDDEEHARVYNAHPFGPFDPSKGFMYVDRVGFRVPDAVAALHRRGKRPLQRSLTPHLDCCPSALYDSGKAVPRWRPIQSLIALTDNAAPETGGFECVKGFHREFDAWAAARAPCAKSGKPAPCIGDFTPIRPQEDAAVIARFAPVLYKAGAVVAFDFRTPHANSSEHRGAAPRQVVYGSFLPDVPINRRYALRQRGRYLDGRRQPDDQWKEGGEGEGPAEPEEPLFEFSEHGWALMGGRPDGIGVECDEKGTGEEEVVV